MPKDVRISIAAGEALLFLESSSGTVPLDNFEQFLRYTGVNVYLILHLLLSEKLISIESGLVVQGKGRECLTKKEAG